jgi:DNA-binding response OmpR family regulator
MPNRMPQALVIDDDEDLCSLLKLVLEEQNFEVEVANTLSQGEKCLEETLPSIIFLDNYLPDGQGIEFIPKIRSLNNGIKIVVITADPSGAMRQRVLGEDNTYFLSKPFSIRSVNDVIDTIHQGRQ